MPDKNQRQSERHRVRFHLVYDDGGTFNAGTVRDVSEGGLFLETAIPLPVGTVVTLTPLDAAGRTVWEVKARVTRVIPYDHDDLEHAAGMGLQFIDLRAEERTDVVSLIRELEAEAASAEADLDPYLGVRVRRNQRSIAPPPRPSDAPEQ